MGDLSKLDNTHSGNPHEAIRVTHLEVKHIEGLAARLGKLYDLIWRNSVSSCMSAYRGEQTTVFICSPLTEHPYIHRVDVPLFLGWKALDSKMDIVKEQTIAASLLLYMKSQKEVICKRISAEVAIHGKKTHFTEASLIKRLEDVGIGRPSTFASLVETLIDRGYVKKGDIEGIPISISEYVFEEDVLQEIRIDKKVGAEKGKLVIQPIGIIVAEFLTEHFDSLFAYDYTRRMEEELDSIAKGELNDGICKRCNEEIDRLIKPVEKRRFVIKDSSSVVVFGRYGLMIQSGSSRQLGSVRKDIDMRRLYRGEYTLDELVENKESHEIGEYNGLSVTLAKGPFGWYISYKDAKIGCKTFLESDTEIELDDEKVYDAFIKHMKAKETPIDENTVLPSGMIRELTPDLSIRNGKYGGYIFYKTPSMKKPKFFPLKGFKESYRFCQKEILMEWIQTTHHVPVI